MFAAEIEFFRNAALRAVQTNSAIAGFCFTVRSFADRKIAKKITAGAAIGARRAAAEASAADDSLKLCKVGIRHCFPPEMMRTYPYAGKAASDP